MPYKPKMISDNFSVEPCIADSMRADVCALRSQHVSLTDISRQTGMSMLSIYEITEGRDVALKKVASMLLRRGIGFPWAKVDIDPDISSDPSVDPHLNAANGVIALLLTVLGDKGMNSVHHDSRVLITELMAEIIRQAVDGDVNVDPS